jgi:ABC-type amino acid transport substrate-binding protein
MLTALVVFCALMGQAMGESPTVFFFSPETNINKYNLLKTEFDTYLGIYGKFQPFNDQETFENEIAGKINCLFLVSSWHYQKLRKENMELLANGQKAKIKMTPALVGVLKDQITQRKIFSTKKSTKNLASLKGKKIASAGSKKYTKQLLTEMLGQDNKAIVDSFRILTVPKDIDALLSLSFDMAEAAITTEATLAKLAKLNPKQHSSLKALAKSEGAFLPIIAIPEGATADTAKLLKIFELMGMETDGRKRLKMIGLDGWKILSDDEKRRLDK